MGLEETKRQGVTQLFFTANEYVTSVYPAAMLVNVLWLLADAGVVADEALQECANFVSRVQAETFPKIADVEAATTESEVWEIVDSFDPSIAVPAPKPGPKHVNMISSLFGHKIGEVK
jgi:hypothetical protein